MNLHAIASRATRVISPVLIGTVFVSAGQVTAKDGSQTPIWCKFENVAMDVQALTGGDLRHIDALNIQGTMRAIYLNGNVEGADRPVGKGGDVIWFNSPLLGGRYWLVTQVLEAWDADGWVKVAVTMQDAAPGGIA